MAEQEQAAKDWKNWQKGHPLEWLQALAQPFKSQYKPFVFGAFGMPKERDIATALEKRQLMWKLSPLGPAAVAFAVVSQRGRKIRTLAGEQAEAQPGEVVIPDIAWLDGWRGHALAVVGKALSLSPVVWLQLNQEDPEHRALARELGARYVGTAIPAGSEIKSWWVVGNGAEQARVQPWPAEDTPALRCLNPSFCSQAEAEQALEEVGRVVDKWGDHYSSYNKRHSWTAVALRGYDVDDHTFIVKPDEMAKSWQEANPKLLQAPCEWTTISSQLPRTMELVQRLPGGERNRVRLMQLSSGGELSRHADVTNRDAGTQPGKLMRLHLPLRTQQDVVFNVWDALGQQWTQHMAALGLYYLDQRKPHRCVNPGGVSRIHLVADVEATPELTAALR